MAQGIAFSKLDSWPDWCSGEKLKVSKAADDEVYASAVDWGGYRVKIVIVPGKGLFLNFWDQVKLANRACKSKFRTGQQPKVTYENDTLGFTFEVMNMDYIVSRYVLRTC